MCRFCVDVRLKWCAGHMGALEGVAALLCGGRGVILTPYTLKVVSNVLNERK